MKDKVRIHIILMSVILLLSLSGCSSQQSMVEELAENSPNLMRNLGRLTITWIQMKL